MCELFVMCFCSGHGLHVVRAGRRGTPQHETKIAPLCVEQMLECELAGSSKRVKAVTGERRSLSATELNNKIVCGSLAAVCTAPVTAPQKFEIGVIDEAGQATEPAVVGVMRRCRHTVLCGDPQQLPPRARTELMATSLLMSSMFLVQS